MNLRESADVTYEVVKVRSLLVPRWWQLRRRFSWWRLNHDEAKRRDRIGEDGRAVEDEINTMVERYFLFGESAPEEGKRDAR